MIVRLDPYSLDIGTLSRAALATLLPNAALTVAARNAVLLDEPINRARVIDLLRRLELDHPDEYLALVSTYCSYAIAAAEAETRVG